MICLYMRYKSCFTADHSYLGLFFLSPLVASDVETLFRDTIPSNPLRHLLAFCNMSHERLDAQGVLDGVKRERSLRIYFECDI